jgi:hypothetical protein
MSEERVSRDERIQPASDNERLGGSRRLAFQIAVGVVMGALLLVFVLQPAVARGGFGELVIVAGIFVAILLLERWLRTR